MVNKKGVFAGTVYFMILVVFIVVLWIWVINPIIQGFVPQALADNNVTGIEAFLWSNINLAFFVTLLLLIIGYAALFRNRGVRYQ